MSDVALVLIGAVASILVAYSWRERDPKLLYIMAGFTVLAGVGSYTSNIGPIRNETIDAFAIAIALAVAGFIVSKRS